MIVPFIPDGCFDGWSLGTLLGWHDGCELGCLAIIIHDKNKRISGQLNRKDNVDNDVNRYEPRGLTRRTHHRLCTRLSTRLLCRFHCRLSYKENIIEEPRKRKEAENGGECSAEFLFRVPYRSVPFIPDGCFDGCELGHPIGWREGWALGCCVGSIVGWLEGCPVGVFPGVVMRSRCCRNWWIRSARTSLPKSLLDLVTGVEVVGSCKSTPNLVLTPSRILAEDRYVSTLNASSSLSFILQLYKGFVVINISSSPPAAADNDTVYGIRNVFSKSNLDCEESTFRVVVLVPHTVISREKEKLYE